jgi:acylphosphatase
LLSLFSFTPFSLHFIHIPCNLATIMKVRAHLVVSGLVQGVGFRYFVLNHAITLGLTGFVRNHYSGKVEIEVEGDRSLIEELIKEVKIGPRAAHVTDIKIEWLKGAESYSSFEVR